MRYVVEVDQEADGRWIADVPDLPGVMSYGATREEAIGTVKALAFRAIAERVQHGETLSGPAAGE